MPFYDRSSATSSTTCIAQQLHSTKAQTVPDALTRNLSSLDGLPKRALSMTCAA
jgi:hypothetical protein